MLILLKQLRKLLSSSFKQTLKEIEIICVNDGSSDNSPNVLKKYTSNNSIITVINQKRRSFAARNKALKIANGKYIDFVDSDDYISENFYELLYTNAKKYNIDIACGEILRPNAIKHKNIFEIKKVKTYKKTE